MHSFTQQLLIEQQLFCKALWWVMATHRRKDQILALESPWISKCSQTWKLTKWYAGKVTGRQRGISCNGSPEVSSMNKAIQKVFTEEEMTALTLAGGIEVCLLWEVEGRFKGAWLPGAKTWRHEKAGSVQEIALSTMAKIKQRIWGGYVIEQH